MQDGAHYQGLDVVQHHSDLRRNAVHRSGTSCLSTRGKPRGQRTVNEAAGDVGAALHGSSESAPLTALAGLPIPYMAIMHTYISAGLWYALVPGLVP